jgi:hypothetical protein
MNYDPINLVKLNVKNKQPQAWRKPSLFRDKNVIAPIMEKSNQATYDNYIKALMDIRLALLSTELIVMTKVIQEELETRKMVERAKDQPEIHYNLKK